MIRVYPAGKSSTWPWWAALQAAGLPISASWISWPFNHDQHLEPSDQDYCEHADVCMREAAAADVVLLFVPPDEERHQFGALLEAGSALGNGKQVFLVSRHAWPFLRNHPRVRSFDQLSDAISALLSMAAGTAARTRAIAELQRTT
jgi:hypothetical protein